MSFYKNEFRRATHHLVKPMIKICATAITGAITDIDREKEMRGYDQELVNRIRKATTAFVENLPKGEQNDLRVTVTHIMRFFCLWMDSERHHFPRWWLDLVREGNKLGIFDEKTIKGLGGIKDGD